MEMDLAEAIPKIRLRLQHMAIEYFPSRLQRVALRSGYIERRTLRGFRAIDSIDARLYKFPALLSEVQQTWMMSVIRRAT